MWDTGGKKGSRASLRRPSRKRVIRTHETSRNQHQLQGSLMGVLGARVSGLRLSQTASREERRGGLIVEARQNGGGATACVLRVRMRQKSASQLLPATVTGENCTFLVSPGRGRCALIGLGIAVDSGRKNCHTERQRSGPLMQLNPPFQPLVEAHRSACIGRILWNWFGSRRIA